MPVTSGGRANWRRSGQPNPAPVRHLWSFYYAGQKSAETRRQPDRLHQQGCTDDEQQRRRGKNLAVEEFQARHVDSRGRPPVADRKVGPLTWWPCAIPIVRNCWTNRPRALFSFGVGLRMPDDAANLGSVGNVSRFSRERAAWNGAMRRGVSAQPFLLNNAAIAVTAEPTTTPRKSGRLPLNAHRAPPMAMPATAIMPRNFIARRCRS